MTDQIAAAEHLKEYTREIIYAYKDGAGHASAPFTAELAVSAIWRKIDEAFGRVIGEALNGTLHLRIEVDKGSTPPVLEDVFTCRCLGAEGKNTQVYYVVCKAKSYAKAVEIVQNFSSVRDWEYYSP